MNAERDILAALSQDDDDASYVRALADIAADRLIDHADVVAWLKTWGTPEHKPMPPEWRE